MLQGSTAGSEATLPTLEAATQQFWKVSRAWRGVNNEHKGWTYSKIIDALSPLHHITVPNRHGVRIPAAVAHQTYELVEMAVHSQVRRTGYNARIIPIQSPLQSRVTQIVGHKTQAA